MGGGRRVEEVERGGDEIVACLGESRVKAKTATGDPLLARDGERILLGGVACGACGHISFPTRPVCPNCLGTEVDEVAVGARATLLMHTVSHVAPAGFEAPLVQAWVELDEGPEVFCLLFCPAEEAAQLSAGQRLSFEVISRGAGVERWGYQPMW